MCSDYQAFRRRRLVLCRSAFTLVELLVVIAIIGVLVALLLPAVQAAREAARRTHCANNLKQIGLAFQVDHDTYNALPNGGEFAATRTWCGNSPCNFKTQAWSWGYQILPFIEQQQLWQNKDDELVAATPVGAYFCPSRRPPTVLAGGYWASTHLPRAQADYAGNGGTFTHSTPWLDWGKVDGVVIRMGNGLINMAKLIDGTSNTLLVGEKRMNLRFMLTDQQPDDNDGYVGGYQDDVVRSGGYPPEADHDVPKYTLQSRIPGTLQFGSSHSGGAQFVMADASVHLISFTVDPETFRRLASRNDGEAVSVDGL
ncbi:MAG: DUF1559 domain-containing protein [Pirellulales bacterium]|nr:DUF1559 domain-containing protein [Pirellulales bacterium]